MEEKYDSSSSESIIKYAKKLIGKSLREACENLDENLYKGKGNYGQTLENNYFGYPPNSNAEPDFPEAGLEVKSSPLKTLKGGDIRSKERLVLNIINYYDVDKESFLESSFWKKNSHLLLVFYLHEKDKSFLDYLIMVVGNWTFPEKDLKIIKDDWSTITDKINKGLAHELSEGDTNYLGACTKGANAASSFRGQPNSDIPAKQRAYSFKQGYVNVIIRSLLNKQDENNEIIKDSESLDSKTFEETIEEKFAPYIGKEINEISQEFGVTLKKDTKQRFAQLTNVILGVDSKIKTESIEEFEKAEIIVRTIRININGKTKENISLPAFKFKELIKEDWYESKLLNRLERKFFFVFYQLTDKGLVLKKVKFWNMPYSDLQEVKQVWENMRENINSGRIISHITEAGIRRNYLPKQSEHRICHVRPHGNDRNDTYPLPVPDKKTGLTEFTKQSFWLNGNYIVEEVYNKH